MAAAIDTIAELGYGQASLARIAEAAGTSKGVIIYHFGGKDELIRELLQELIARAGAYMRPRIEAEQTGAGMLRAFIESNLAFMAENRNHVAATVEIALNARAADGSRLFGQRFNDAAVASVAEILIYFQGTGEFRADFDPQVMALAVRAAIDTVGPRLVRDPGQDVEHHARELASMFVRAARKEEIPPAAHHPHQEES
jgi:AcrR family transcriptional regulator